MLNEKKANLNAVKVAKSVSSGKSVFPKIGETEASKQAMYVEKYFKESDIEYLRREIKRKLKSAESKKRIHIDKGILEQLIFKTTYVIDGDKKIKIKYFNWVDLGTLQKIDLSELDTSHVLWANFAAIKEYKKLASEQVELDTIKNYINSREEYPSIDLSKTNIKPHFKDGFKFVNRNGEEGIYIKDVKLEDVDLSEEVLPENTHINISGCSFKNTNLQLNLNRLRSVSVKESCLDGINLSDSCVNGNIFLGSTNLYFYRTSLVNTGLHINTSNTLEEYIDLFKFYLNNGNLDGCYVNGHLIHSKKELSAVKKENLRKYRTFIRDVSNSILSDIDKQLTMKPKKNTDVK